MEWQHSKSFIYGWVYAVLDNAYTNTTSDSWQDDRGAKRTRTITINGDNVTIELKSERNNTAEGKGIVSHKAQLTKTS